MSRTVAAAGLKEVPTQASARPGEDRGGGRGLGWSSGAGLVGDPGYTPSASGRNVDCGCFGLKVPYPHSYVETLVLTCESGASGR